MKFALVGSRFQPVTLGSVEDIAIAHELAFEGNATADEELRLLRKGEASINVAEAGFAWEPADRLIVQIAGADPWYHAYSLKTPQARAVAAEFRDPERNPLTYFERMVALKEAATVELGRTLFVPHQIRRLDEEAWAAFEPRREDIAFRYLAVPDDHHYRRARRTAEKGITTLYHVRNEEENERRAIPLEATIRSVREREYLVVPGIFDPADEGLETRVGWALGCSPKEDPRDIVLAVTCYLDPGERRRNDFLFDDATLARLDATTPFEKAVNLYGIVDRLGADREEGAAIHRRVHVTFLPPGPIEGSRAEWYLPSRFGLLDAEGTRF